MANNCDIYLLSTKTLQDDTVVKFPIVDYSNVFYDASHASLQPTIDKFLEYCKYQLGVDTFVNVSSIDFTKSYFKVQKNYAASNQYNYCLIHDNHDDKWYCCFVNSVTWDANLVTATFNFEIDVFHTYIKSVKFRECFIEREHVTNDTFGAHVLDEGIGVSEYVAVSSTPFGNQSYKQCLLISDTTLFTNIGDTVRDIVNVSPLEKSTCMVTIQNSTNGEKEFNDFFNEMVYQNKSNSIVAMYYIPDDFVNDNYFQRAEYNSSSTGQMISRYAYISKNNTSPITFNDLITTRLLGAVTYPDGRSYTPLNNKSRIYPFSFLEISNNQGGKIQCKFELSNNKSQINVRYQNSILHSGSPYLYLRNYDGIETNMEKSLSGIQNPDIPYIHYSYGSYIAANRNSLENTMNYIKSDKDLALFNNDIDTVQTQTGQIASAIGNALSLNVGAYTSNMMDFINTEVDYRQNVNNIKYSANKSMDAVNAKLRDVKTQGNTSQGVFTTNGCLMLNKCGFSRYYFFPQYEELKTIDHYFSKFGYKINDYDVPNLNTRPLFNYVKCSEVNMTGNIPSEYLSVMKAIFSAGVTLWHNLDRMYDFDFEHNLAATR